MSITFSRRFHGDVAAAWLAVAAALALNLYWLAPELAIARADLNDNVLHYGLAVRMAEAIEHGENPFDHWVSEWTLGYPVPRTYQPLGSFTMAALYLALGKSVPLMTLFVWMRFLLLLLFPLSVYLGARLMELDRLRAAAAALAAPLIATNGLYGLDHGSYVWRGSGLYTQAWAMHLLALTLGCGYRSLSRGRGRTLCGALLAMTFLSHLLYGYMAALSLLLLAALHPNEVPLLRRAARLAWIAAVSLALTASFLLPLWIDKPLINRSRWEAPWKWNSFGFVEVTRQLLSGDLLDYGRLPVLTLLAASGIVIWGLARWRPALAERFAMSRTPPAALLFAVAGAALWLFLYCGRQSWGVLFALLGAGEEAPLHRLIGGVHLFALLLCGIALGSLWHWFRLRGGWQAPLGAALATLALLSPALAERHAFLAQGVEWGRQNLAAHDAAAAELERAMAEVKSRPGRSFAGLAGDWGREFRVGSAPLYGQLATHNEPAIGMLYHAMALTSDITVRFNEWRADHYRLFNVSALLADSSRPVAGFLAPAGRHGRLQVYEAPGGGYFDLVRAPYSVRIDKSSFYEVNDAWLASDWVEKRQHIRLDFTPGALPELPPLDSTATLPVLEAAQGLGEIRGEARNGEVYSAEVSAGQACYLLFKMTYHPNWRVLVNGEPRAAVTLTPGMLGVALDPGEYRVECRYEPEAWRTPLMAVGLLGGLLLLVAERRGMAAAAEGRGAAVVARGWQAVPEQTRRRLAIAAGLGALALPVCVPLATDQMLLGHDAYEYLPRLVEFHENIRHGVVMPRWAADLSRGYGQPFFVFNPPLLYYLAEIWLLAGVDPLPALNLTCALIVAGSAASMFLLGRLWFGTWGGFLAAAAYVYAPYFHVDLFVRHALAEFAAFGFYPLAFYGFARYARDHNVRFLLLGGAAYAGVIAAHHPAAFLFSPLLLGFAAFQALLARSWRLLTAQLGALALGLGLGASVWLPALAERGYVKLDRLLEGYLQYANHFVYLHQLFAANWGYGISTPGYSDGMSFSLGWSHVLLALLGCVSAMRWRGGMGRSAEAVERRRLVAFLGACCVAFGALMLAGSEWFWTKLPLLSYIEFPWRILGPVSFCLALLAAAAAQAIQRAGAWRKMAMAAAMMLLILPNLPHIAPAGYQPVDLRQWSPEQIARRGISVTTRNEYEPRWAEAPAYRTDSVRVVAGWAQGELQRLSPAHWSGGVQATAESTIEIACFFFPGWQATVDGLPVPIDTAPRSGLMRLSVPPGEHRIELTFGRTPARAAADALSVLSLLVLGGLWVWSRRKPSRDQGGGDPSEAVSDPEVEAGYHK
jgi:hypothetical protein